MKSDPFEKIEREIAELSDAVYLLGGDCEPVSVSGHAHTMRLMLDVVRAVHEEDKDGDYLACDCQRCKAMTALREHCDD